MNNIKLICDSLSDIPKELIDKYDIHVVPLTVIFDGKEYIDGIDLSKQEFYKMLRNSEDMPKTSQCTYIQFRDAFKRYLNKGNDILYIGGSSVASGTFQSAMMAKNDLDGNIYMVDTQNLSIGSGCLLLSAAEMLERKADIKDILNHLENLKESVKVLFTVDTLEYLQKGGRISLAKATIGNMLNIKPVLSIEEGLVKPINQVRGKKQVVSKILSLIKENFGEDLTKKRIILGFGDNNKEFNSFVEKLKEDFKIDEIISVNVSTCICAHSGPGIIGIACCDK
ncbi:DegV family protein [Paraclostridium tenue]|uniref:DegV family protein n=1 Tax=Paeniclostridium hominis TaxID=2764329 RepID=A0ABR7K6C9_9FIRM|nr:MULTISPECIES: DegV family protein [Paeniclostridium]MBC6004662.1 DegV family protein [Paeniclostridium hominis]